MLFDQGSRMMVTNKINAGPEHVAIIMDGNGRWAKELMLPRQFGHFKGAQVAKKIIRHVSDNTDVSVLTIWGYSTDNNSRPSAEVDALMNIFKKFIIRNTEELHEENVHVTFIGDLTRLPLKLQKVAHVMRDRTVDNTGLHLQIALSYLGDDEIERAVRKIAQKVQSGELDYTKVNTEIIYAHLDTVGVRNPDLIIRTSGEQRMSGFMPLQSSKSELVFVKDHWPAFTPQHFDQALIEYGKRERRFGGIAETTAAE